MSGENLPYGRTYSVQEADEILGRRSVVLQNLTVEDVVLLLLHADPRPIGGRVDLAAQVFLAVTEVLGGSGVEPGIFRRAGPGLQRADRAQRALEELAFTGNVAVSGGGDGGCGHGREIRITARGRDRARDLHARLPAPVMAALARKRDEWAKLSPDPDMNGRARVRGSELSGRLAPQGRPCARGREDARGAAPRDSGHQGPASSTDPAPCGGAEKCYANGRAHEGRGERGRAVRPFKRDTLPDPAHASRRSAMTESTDVLEGHNGAAESRDAAALPMQGPRGASAGPAAGGSVSAPAPGALPEGALPEGARDAPARRKKRRYPRISGFPSLVGMALKSPKKGSRVDILTQFELYRDEQLSQSEGIFAQNIIHELLSNQVYPLILRASDEWPNLKDFVLYAVQIVMNSKKELNDMLVNEDVKLRVLCQTARKGVKEGDEVFENDIKEIISIGEIGRDPDAAIISLLCVRGRWFGKFDLIYNRNIVHQKLKRALKFLNDSMREDASLEARYNSLWSGCELLAESTLLLHNMITPKSTHKSIKRGLDQLLKSHSMPYIEEYTEIAQIRDSLRYGPPHPDRSREAKEKMAHLLDKSLEFAFFAIHFLERRQVSVNGDGQLGMGIFDPAKGPAYYSHSG